MLSVVVFRLFCDVICVELAICVALLVLCHELCYGLLISLCKVHAIQVMSVLLWLYLPVIGLIISSISGRMSYHGMGHFQTAQYSRDSWMRTTSLL